MLPRLASALALRDPATAAHAARVTFLAGRLAEWLGWDVQRLAELRIGAPLHDIGKVFVSPELLRKRGPLNSEELAEIRTHPVEGAKLVGANAPTRAALPYVLYHHERWDGCGYPTGRAGTAIPEGARLLSITDAFDAMTSMRPYRRALPEWRALGEIKRCAGTQFDPDLARGFLAAWSEGVLVSRPAAAG
jgi:HD-GYP domain-containing protein (c-di-GMP phosphodiesterase class II)